MCYNWRYIGITDVGGCKQCDVIFHRKTTIRLKHPMVGMGSIDVSWHSSSFNLNTPCSHTSMYDDFHCIHPKVSKEWMNGWMNEWMNEWMTSFQTTRFREQRHTMKAQSTLIPSGISQTTKRQSFTALCYIDWLLSCEYICILYVILAVQPWQGH